MLFSLVKKDFILVKKELLILLIASIGLPVFLIVQLKGSSMGGFFAFFLTALFMEYMLFNTVSMSEFKYKGSSLLCATPYTRSTMVKAKYLFMLINFLCMYIVFTLTVSFMNQSITLLNAADFGMSLLIITVFFSIIIPFQYKFGFQKTRYASYFIVFATPFAAPAVVKWMYANKISLNITILLPSMVSNLIPCLLALIIGYISMIISINIYSKENL